MVEIYKNRIYSIQELYGAPLPIDFSKICLSIFSQCMLEITWYSQNSFISTVLSFLLLLHWPSSLMYIIVPDRLYGTRLYGVQHMMESYSVDLLAYCKKFLSKSIVTGLGQTKDTITQSSSTWICTVQGENTLIKNLCLPLNDKSIHLKVDSHVMQKTIALKGVTDYGSLLCWMLWERQWYLEDMWRIWHQDAQAIETNVHVPIYTWVKNKPANQKNSKYCLRWGGSLIGLGQLHLRLQHTYAYLGVRSTELSKIYYWTNMQKLCYLSNKCEQQKFTLN